MGNSHKMEKAQQIPTDDKYLDFDKTFPILMKEIN